jgi:flagellin-like protein
MQPKSELSRRWRKSGKRGVSPIIATILLVAITVVLAAVLYILISGLTKGPGNTPIGTTLAVGKPIDASNAANNWYNLTISSAGTGLTYASLNFQVQTTSNGIVNVGASTITVVAVTACNVAVYTFSTNSWAAAAGANACASGTLGGTAPETSGQQLSIKTANTLSLVGNNLIIVGAGSYSGSETVAIT